MNKVFFLNQRKLLLSLIMLLMITILINNVNPVRAQTINTNFETQITDSNSNHSDIININSIEEKTENSEINPQDHSQLYMISMIATIVILCIVLIFWFRHQNK